MKSRYDMLLRPSGSISEVAEILYPISGLGPVGDAAGIYDLCKDEMHKLIYASLDFIRFKDDEGKFLDVIPEELGIGLRDKVLEEYQSFLDTLDMERMVADAEAEVLGRVERYAWNNGVRVLPEALDQMMTNLSRCAEEYERLDDPVDDKGIMTSFEEARKNTFIERVRAANSDDILVYRLEMIEYLEKMCSMRMYGFFERFFAILASSSVFIDLRNKLEDLRKYLMDMGLSGEEASDMSDVYEDAPGVVFTDIKEQDPAGTLGEYIRLLSENL